jgi:dTDP-glucose 4,6-dehydratase
MKKKILIIGSNSFSGSNMINYLLKKDFNIIGVSRSKEPSNIFLPYKKNLNKNFIFKKLNLNKDINKVINLIKKFKPQYIINYAAQSMVSESFGNSEQWYKTNILSQIRLFNFL